MTAQRHAFQSLRRLTVTPRPFELTLECRIDNAVPKWLDKSHIRLTKPASRLHVDGHLRLVPAVIASDPREMHYSMDRLVGNFCGEFVFGAVQRDKWQMVEMHVIRRAEQLVR